MLYQPNFFDADLDALPNELVVTHTPEKVLARKNSSSGKTYTWIYKTTVTAKCDAVIVAFGGFAWDGKAWVFSNFSDKPFGNQEFAEWYQCPKGELNAHQQYSDHNNWTGSDTLRSSKTKWYFIAKSLKGHYIKGEAVVEMLAEELDQATEFAEQIREHAEFFRKIALEKMSVQLNYDEAGVRWLDGYIERMRHQSSVNDSVKTCAACFFSACILATYKGKWELHPEYGWMITLDHNVSLFPFNKVNKHFENEDGDSILGLFTSIPGLMKLERGEVEKITMPAPPPPRALTFSALCFLYTFDHQLPMYGGLAEEDLLRQYNLDYSVASLKRIDDFLDALNATGKYQADDFLDSQETQNLLYLLSFYVGEVISRCNQKHLLWCSFDELNERVPNATMGASFENSATLFLLDAGNKLSNLFWPLASITSRLLSPYQDKSVLFSASAHIPAKYQQESLMSQALPALAAPAWPIDVAQQVKHVPPSKLGEIECVMPDWAIQDKLSYLFENDSNLLNDGHVVWAAVVQANSLLFEPDSLVDPTPGAPGEVVYDPLGRVPVLALKQIAHQLYSLKGTEVDDPAMAYFSEYLQNERIRVFGLAVPQQISPYPLKVSTTYFTRAHLPAGILLDTVIPILISDRCPGAALPLPQLFWTPLLKQQWLEIYQQLRNSNTKQFYPDPELAHLHPMSDAEEGLLWFKGSGVQVDYAKALIAWKKSASKNNAAGLNGLGMLYEQGLGVTADLQLALSYYQKALQLGYTSAQQAIDRLTSKKNNAASQAPAKGFFSRLFGKK